MVKFDMLALKPYKNWKCGQILFMKHQIQINNIFKCFIDMIIEQCRELV